MEEQSENRKEAIKNWFKNKHNLTLVGILIFAIVIRLYYFSLTSIQPLWWDESDYLAYAKNLAGFNVEWIVTAKHNSLYPFLVAALFKVGFSEAITRFFLQIVPSILTVLLVYLVTIEMYEDKRIALVASFLMASFWVVLFNSMRFHIGIPAFFTGLLSIYVFWKGYENKEKFFWKINPKWAIPVTVFLVILTYSIRRGYFLFGFFFLIYMLSTRKWKSLIKDKYNWIGLGLAAILFFLSEKFIFTSQIANVSQGYLHTENPINLLPLRVFPSFFVSLSAPWASVLLYLFWFGVLVLIFSIFLSFGHIKKMKKSVARSDLFNILTIIITLALFIFILRF